MVDKGFEALEEIKRFMVYKICFKNEEKVKKTLISGIRKVSKIKSQGLNATNIISYYCCRCIDKRSNLLKLWLKI